ncbi:serine/threonine-protein kinase RIO3-like [Chelonus insularis]|uniref:serine/threonine-protein kinase RIO3-like n=1 Tax=Chelonus insularis TaxID=460826 RepID=UPI00158C7E3B|nr:serine/threonine-protein kinase RIO3-like [Chelonus insularis]
MASPWAKIQPMMESLSIDEITAEEVVKNMQKRELERYNDFIEQSKTSEPINTDNDGVIAQLLQQQYDQEKVKLCDNDMKTDAPKEEKELNADGIDTDNDVAIAQMLQHQYNRDYDHMIKKTEEKLNGLSKVGVSLSNYLIGYEAEAEEKDNTNDEEQDLDRFVSIEKEFADVRRCGYKKNAEGSGIVTKHDVLMSSRINACRVLEFPPGISTGDTGGFDVKLNNKVFNSLKVHNHAFCARQNAKTRPNNK